MSPRVRSLTSLGIGAVVAALLPVYPWRSESRSFMVGSGGDRIDHEWSLNMSFALLERARYRSAAALPLALNVLWFVLLASVVALAVHRLLRRRA